MEEAAIEDNIAASKGLKSINNNKYRPCKYHLFYYLF
jgi:hypothetical protein